MEKSTTTLALAQPLEQPTFPGSANIPPLPEALTPENVARHLERLPLYQWCGPLPVIDTRRLASRQDKSCTFEVSMDARFVGKVYARDRRDVYDYMQALQQVGFGPQSAFSIPQPLAYLPSLHLLLQEKVEGASAQEIFSQGDERQCAEAAERSAGWLARFHALAPGSGKIWDAERWLRYCASKGLLLVREWESLAIKAQELWNRLRAARPALGQAPTRAAHGDFGVAQIILGRERMAVCDWDSHGIADPACDVARFLVSLEHLRIERRDSSRTLANAARVFQTTYLASTGQAQISRWLPFYKAALSLRRARSDLDKGPAPHPDWAEAMLETGLAYLERAVES